MQREMKVEGNRPGYRSETVRGAIEGSATNALLQAGEVAGDLSKRLLGGSNDAAQKDEKVAGAVMEGLLLGGEKWKTEPIDPPIENEEEQQPQQQPFEQVATTAATIPWPVLELTREDLFEEKARFAACLCFCLERPDQSCGCLHLSSPATTLKCQRMVPICMRL
mmetsp:Transcript_33862/g.51043  ORF Transcript_33862/g.51043 Transcript_33862/m.51043 type:complete len:165 (-) Transcript_33862:1778-2272(-)